MIKINLLPPGIFEARAIKRLIVLFAVLVVGIVGGCMYYTSKVNAEKEQYASDAVIAEGLRDKAKNIFDMAKAERGKIQPITEKLTFMDEVLAHNLKYPKLYEELSKFTYHKVIYSQLSVSQDGTVTIAAYAPSLMDAGRYLLNMYRATHLFSSVGISAVPGYPADGSGSAGGGLAAGGMPTLAGAPPPMTPTGLGGEVTTPSQGTAFGGMGAIASGLGRSAARRSGFNFTVTCTLKDPSITLAPSAAGGAAPGTPGMMPLTGGLTGPAGS